MWEWLKMIGLRKKTKCEIIVNVESLETRVAIVEDGHLEEFFIERPTEERIVGSIYKGRIQNMEDGLQALEYVQHHGDQLELVVMDLVMPCMGGRDAIAAIRELHPDMPIVIISGNEPAHQEQQTRHAVFLRKPFSLSEMRGALGQLSLAPA